jgi:hypothetical protein
MSTHRTIRILLSVAVCAAGSIVVATSAPVLAIDTSDNTPWVLPTAPPRCTQAQADSGDVGECLLAFWDDPTDTGWGVPPAPGVGGGWVWNGYTYNGSPALAGWESTYISSNTAPVAGIRTGTLQTHTYAQPLFEGFLAEIGANGYRVLGAGGYTFRCTSGNGGWICPTGDTADLSLHAYGLAIDMNSGTNPIRSYSGIGGRSACLTPIQTDIPEWVVRTAERWGLYWGGYGWNQGCPSPETQRTIVSRDPPHFEFRGTPEQAQAILDVNLANDPKRVCFATVADDGTDVERCNTSGRPGAGWRLPIETGAPAGTQAVLVNLAVAQPDARGHASVETCDPIEGPRTTSSLTYAAGQTVSSLAVAPVDENGRFCVFASASTHRVVDVISYLTDSGDQWWFEPAMPIRLTDTRQNGSCTPTQECHAGAVGDGQQHVVTDEQSPPMLVNLAVVSGERPGYLQAGACDSLGTESSFAQLNYGPDEVRSNLTLVESGDAATCVFALRQTHVIVDELGSLSQDGGLGWDLSTTGRVLDTRECTPTRCAGEPKAGELIRIETGIDAPAAAIALTAANPSTRGYLWAGPCSYFDDGRDHPETANLNHVPGATVTNLALVELEAGAFCVFVRDATHVVVDVQAALTDSGGLGIVRTAPTRVADSRLDGVRNS